MCKDLQHEDFVQLYIELVDYVCCIELTYDTEATLVMNCPQVLTRVTRRVPVVEHPKTPKFTPSVCFFSYCIIFKFLCSALQIIVWPFSFDHCFSSFFDKRQGKAKPKRESRMDSRETLATLGTQDTERIQTKQKTQHKKLKT